jgi:hypothetical protein
MKGETVIVRSFKGKPLVRKVWDFQGDVVLICDDDNYRALSQGEDGLWPVGFKVGDIFKYSERLALQILKNDAFVPDWNALEHWDGQ